MKDGQRHSFNVSDVARIEFDMGAQVNPAAPPSPAPPAVASPAPGTAAPFLTNFTSGKQLSCQVRASATKAWDCRIKVSSYSPGTGAFTGQIDWPGLGSIHVIQGTIQGNTLRFREVSVIRRGAANLNSTYEFTIGATGATGTWHDPANNPPSGSAVINNK